MKVFVSLVLGALLAATAAAQTHVSVATVEPRADDIATIDGMVKAYYEVVSGPAGQPRDWARS